MARLVWAAVVVLGVSVSLATFATAQTPACPAPEPPGGCVERCDLPRDFEASPSEAFLAKVRDIGPTGHHVDSSLGPSLVRRQFSFEVRPVGFPRDSAQRWEVDHRWAGPCTGLRAVFTSKAVEDVDPRNVVDLYELRYRTEDEAQRVAKLLVTSWDWNYHPYVAVPSGNSVLVAEGRHRAWGPLKKVAALFGAKFSAGRQR